MFLRRGAPEHASAIRHIAMQPRTGADEGSLPDSQMTRRTGLGHHDRSSTHDRPTGETRLGHDQGVLADVAVVSDLDQIVDLRTPSNARLVQGRAIDGRVRTDFDVVLDDDATALSHRDGTAAFIQHIAEPIRAEHDPGLEYDAVPDSSVFTQDGAGVDPTITAEFDLRHQRRVRRDDATGTHSTSRPNDRAGFDRCSRIDHGGCVDIRANRDALRWTRGRSKFSNQSGKVMCGVRAAKRCSTFDIDARSYDERAGLARSKRGRVCGVA